MFRSESSAFLSTLFSVLALVAVGHLIAAPAVAAPPDKAKAAAVPKGDRIFVNVGGDDGTTFGFLVKDSNDWRMAEHPYPLRAFSGTSMQHQANATFITLQTVLRDNGDLLTVAKQLAPRFPQQGTPMLNVDKQIVSFDFVGIDKDEKEMKGFVAIRDLNAKLGVYVVLVGVAPAGADAAVVEANASAVQFAVNTLVSE